MKKAPSISVVIATYNGERYIYQQMQSILSQVGADAEIIVTDNGSFDNTINIIAALKDERVKIMQYAKTKSVKDNFENGLMHAQGDMIFLSDQDDIWLPEKVKVMAEALKIYDLAVSDCKIIDAEGRVIKNSFFSFKNSGAGIIKNLVSNTYIGSCMAFKKSMLGIALPFPEDVPLHDIWLGFVGNLFFKPVFIKQALILYRRHGNNVSITGEKSKYSLLQKISFRYRLIKYLPMLMRRKKLMR